MTRDEGRSIDDLCYEIWKEVNGIWGNSKRRRSIHVYLNALRTIARQGSTDPKTKQPVETG